MSLVNIDTADYYHRMKRWQLSGYWTELGCRRSNRGLQSLLAYSAFSERLIVIGLNLDTTLGRILIDVIQTHLYHQKAKHFSPVELLLER